MDDLLGTDRREQERDRLLRAEQTDRQVPSLDLREGSRDETPAAEPAIVASNRSLGARAASDVGVGFGAQDLLRLSFENLVGDRMLRFPTGEHPGGVTLHLSVSVVKIGTS